jgi:aspartyl-tRNA(Asn)/glutamyl-tRNA(Gln) amidotransferase subunit B
MRTKNDAIDYRYITEPNIVACDIANLINQTEVSEANKPECVESFLNAQGVNPTIIQQLLDNYSLYKVFKYVCEKTNDYNAATT